MDNHVDIIKSFISKFKLNLIHTHVNTYSKKENIVLELTFSKNAIISNDKWSQLSLDGIDFPNNPSHKNIQIV